MDTNDRKAIEDLFGKLSTVEQQSGPRDGEAERFIEERVRQQPAAPYLMAQTIVMQEMALENQNREIEALRRQAETAQQGAGGGGFLSRMFGGDSQNRSAPQARSGMGGMGGAAARPASGPWGGAGAGMAGAAQPGMMAGRGGGGGFLAGAAQTAMGVAGGVLLGNAIAGMFDGNEAQAAEPGADAAAEEPAAQESAVEDEAGFMDDGGFGDEEF